MGFKVLLIVTAPFSQALCLMGYGTFIGGLRINRAGIIIAEKDLARECVGVCRVQGLWWMWGFIFGLSN